MIPLTEVAADVFELRLPIPFEDGLVNVFLFKDGAEVDMLDCGMNSGESLESIRLAMDHLGAGRLRRLAVTHIHPDHYGAAGMLAGEGLADLYIHRLEVPLVHPRYVELEHLVKEVRTYLLVNGLPSEEAEVLSNSQRALSQLVKTAEPSVQLEGAESLQMGRRRLRVEWTPGHSPGHICLFDETDKLLFAGDHMLPELSPNIGLHPQSTPDPLHEYLEGSSGSRATGRDSSCLLTDDRSPAPRTGRTPWSRITAGVSSRSSRSWVGRRSPAGRLRSNSGVPAASSMRRGWRSRKVSPISRRWPSTAC